jgi:hypothetical protein
MSNKKIDINPDLFTIGNSSKTRKKREKKQKPTNVPLISPNVLKNKLLKRIKEHKTKETENLENNKKKLPDLNDGDIGNNINTNNSTNLEIYTDEFNDSINYLQSLSKQNKINEEKVMMEKNKQKLREDLERRTVKNYQSILSTPNSLPIVNIDLPDELKEPLIPVNMQQINVNPESMTLSTYKIDTLPYGCLKNGIKPTYKVWNKTQKNISNDYTSQPNLTTIIEQNNNLQISERENRLNILKNKIKEKQNFSDKVNNVIINNPQINTNNTIQESFVPSINNNNNNNNNINNNINNNNKHTILQNTFNANMNTNIYSPENTNNTELIEIPTKKIIKKTICRRYTLGKSKIKKSIGVLIKDRGTRKQVLVAHRDLKKKSINDIKSYLKEHNLIKIGSTAPNDVIRKLYESSMLAGEITNINTDTLLHNLIKDDKEL